MKTCVSITAEMSDGVIRTISADCEDEHEGLGHAVKVANLVINPDPHSRDLESEADTLASLAYKGISSEWPRGRARALLMRAFVQGDLFAEAHP